MARKQGGLFPKVVSYGQFARIVCKMNWMPRKFTNGMFKIIWIGNFGMRKKPLVAMKDKEEEKRRDK